MYFLGVDIDPGLAIVFVVLLGALLLPHFADRLGLEDELEHMRRQSALRYGLDLDALASHEFRSQRWTTSLFSQAECPVCLEKGKLSWALLVQRSGRKCGHFFCSDCAELTGWSGGRGIPSSYFNQ